MKSLHTFSAAASGQFKEPARHDDASRKRIVIIMCRTLLRFVYGLAIHLARSRDSDRPLQAAACEREISRMKDVLAIIKTISESPCFTQAFRELLQAMGTIFGFGDGRASRGVGLSSFNFEEAGKVDAKVLGHLPGFEDVLNAPERPWMYPGVACHDQLHQFYRIHDINLVRSNSSSDLTLNVKESCSHDEVGTIEAKLK